MKKKSDGRRKLPLFGKIKKNQAEPPTISPQKLDPFLALHGTLQDPNKQKLQDLLREEIYRHLALAMETKNVGSYEAQYVAQLHKRWICLFWKEGMYSKQAHLILADIYVADTRFTAWYDNRVGKGGAQFLRDAIEVSLYRVGMPLPDKEIIVISETNPQEKISVPKKALPSKDTKKQ